MHKEATGSAKGRALSSSRSYVLIPERFPPRAMTPRIPKFWGLGFRVSVDGFAEFWADPKPPQACP